ncbi:MAG: hypothetical protein WBQ86_01400 [Candidatus Binatus sp.]
MAIVFVEAKERTAQNFRAIDTKYQRSLLVKIGYNRVEVYQDYRDVETFQDSRRSFVFLDRGRRFHSGTSPDMSGLRPVARWSGSSLLASYTH